MTFTTLNAGIMQDRSVSSRGNICKKKFYMLQVIWLAFNSTMIVIRSN